MKLPAGLRLALPVAQSAPWLAPALLSPLLLSGAPVCVEVLACTMMRKMLVEKKSVWRRQA